MNRKIRFYIFIIIALWCFGIFIEWFAKIDGHLILALPFLQKTYSLVCHQEINKLISWDGLHTLTCARCTGIYLGLLFSSTMVLFRLPKKIHPIKFLLIAAIPMMADVVFYTFGVYPYSKVIAFSTGLLLGSIGFFYLYVGLIKLIDELKH